MKKRKILVLFPVLGLLLSGCTFQEALGNVKDWTNGHIIDPIKNLINGGEKEEQKDDEDDPTPTPSPSEVVLSSVEFKSGPKTVKVGESVDPSSVKLTATYSDASTKEVAAEKVTVDTSVAAENVEGIAEYQGKTAAFTINVIEAPDTEHAGTEEDPFSAEDAVAVANSLGEGQVTEESYYIKGVVEDLEEAFNPSYGNYSFRFVGGFVAWRLKFGPNYEKLAEGAVEAGDTVTVYAQIQLFGNSKTPETKGGYITKIEKPAIDAKLVEVTLEGNPQTTYLAGAAYNHDGLSAIAHYDNGETQDVSLAADWEISKETAELGDETITISVTYLEFGASMAITVTVQDNTNPVHAGTEEDPYDGYDAVIVAGKLTSGQATEDSYYIKGEVINFEENFNPTYGNYSFKIEGGFIGWRLKNGPEFALFEEGDLQVGDTVTMYAQIQAYGNDCKPETKGGYIVSIERPVVDVEGVSLDRNELNMEVGMPDETLVATVAPANATNKAVTWESSNSEVATVSEGVVHAVAAGDAVITVKSVADSTKTAACSVHVTQPEKELTSIEVTTMPTVEYTEGDLLDLTGMVVTLHYNDQSSAEITSGWTTNIAADHELTLEDVSLVVSYGGFDADPIALTITAKPQPVHEGTAEDPYTIHDCEIVYANAKLEQGKDIGAEIYVTGTILADPAATIADGRGRLYIGDSSSENSLYIYNINNVGGSANLTLADIPAGSEILAKGTLKNYNGMQLCYVKNVANCEFISIDKPFVAPETVTITSGSELGVGSSMNLAATVGPEGAAQDVEWSIVSEGEFATLSDGVLTGVAAGEVTVRATAKGYENVYAEKTITISSTVVPTEQAIYTLDGTVTGGSSGYAEASAITQGDVEWAVVGNTTMNPWRIGGKNLSGVDRTVTSKSAFSDDITKVVVTTGTKTLSAVNSVTLLVGTTEGASDVDSIQLTQNLVSASLEFARPEGHSWANCYFTVVFNVNAASSNQYIQLLAVTLYAMK